MSVHEVGPIAVNQQNETSKVRNTFETQNSKNSKNDNEIDPDEHFKIQRKKYLQQRMKNRRQMKNIKKKQFGSSSSESQQEKPIEPNNLVKDSEIQRKSSIASSVSRQQNKSNSIPEQPQKIIYKQTFDEDEFHKKHQEYIRQKLARKKQIIQIKKKQFGSSSSDSDEQENVGNLAKKVKVINLQESSYQKHEVELKSEKSQKSHNHGSFEQRSSINQTQKKKIFKSPNSLNNLSSYHNNSPAKQHPISEIKKFSILFQSKKTMQWIQQTLIIQNKKLKFLNQNIEFLINFISKIKLFFSYPANYTQFMKMKITYKQEDYFFAVSRKIQIQGLDQYYYVFGRIVQDKLKMIGIEPRKNQPSMFPNYMNLKDMNPNIIASSFVYGYVLKKSQYMGNWETRFISIAPGYIVSCKKPSDKPSMLIPCESICELWTRFDVEGSNMLNVKILYNTRKTQFGIPISQFENKHNWLYCLYQVIANKK